MPGRKEAAGGVARTRRTRREIVVREERGVRSLGGQGVGEAPVQPLAARRPDGRQHRVAHDRVREREVLGLVLGEESLPAERLDHVEQRLGRERRAGLERGQAELAARDRGDRERRPGVAGERVDAARDELRDRVRQRARVERAPARVGVDHELRDEERIAGRTRLELGRHRVHLIGRAPRRCTRAPPRDRRRRDRPGRRSSWAAAGAGRPRRAASGPSAGRAR